MRTLAPHRPAPVAAAAADRLEGILLAPIELRPSRVALGVGAVTPEDAELMGLHVAYWRRRGAAEREALVERYRPMATNLARRFQRGRESMDDLEQVAMVGLLLALDRFDPSRRLPFRPFATSTITGSLKRHFRDRGWALRVPRRVHDLSSALRDAREQLAADLGRHPTPGEVADLLGIDESQVVATEAAQAARSTASIDHLPDDDRRSPVYVGVIDEDLERVHQRHAVEQAVRLLSPRDRELIGLYYEDGLTQSQIAERMGISQMHVSRLLDRALAQLRSHLPA